MKDRKKQLTLWKQELLERLRVWYRFRYGKWLELKGRTARVLTEKSGEGFVDSAVRILISIVIGSLLLAGLYTLFDGTVLPLLTERIKSLFDYKG